MSSWLTAVLPDRGVISVKGADAPAFLQGLLTAPVENLLAGQSVFAGLLSPQGKILFDFFVNRTTDGFLLDCPRAKTAECVRRLMMYRLRANVEIEDVSADYTVEAIWGPETERPDIPGSASVFADPRHQQMGFRLLATLNTDGVPFEIGAKPSGANTYHAHRVELGIPESGYDYELGDAFPHDAMFDQIGAVDFRKGCYVGQEVVSRMHHRKSARRRIVRLVTTDGEDFPAEAGGADVCAGDAKIGRVGTVAGSAALAMLRVDRLAEATSKGEPITAGGSRVEAAFPDWMELEIAPK